jgi:hypothetical protein
MVETAPDQCPQSEPGPLGQSEGPGALEHYAPNVVALGPSVTGQTHNDDDERIMSAVL